MVAMWEKSHHVDYYTPLGYKVKRIFVECGL